MSSVQHGVSTFPQARTPNCNCTRASEFLNLVVEAALAISWLKNVSIFGQKSSIRRSRHPVEDVKATSAASFPTAPPIFGPRTQLEGVSPIKKQGARRLQKPDRIQTGGFGVDACARVAHWPPRSKYVGEWQSDLKHGQAVEESTDQCIGPPAIGALSHPFFRWEIRFP